MLQRRILKGLFSVFLGVSLGLISIATVSAQSVTSSLPAIINLLLDDCLFDNNILDSADLESNPANFIATGDWQRGAPTGFAGGSESMEPPTALSGSNVFGTILGGDHSASLVSTLTNSLFNFSSEPCPAFVFHEWIASGSNFFDKAEVLVNGDVVYLSDGDSFNQWRRVELNLSEYAGVSSVTIQFRFTATTVVERVGWYLDDFEILGQGFVP